MHRMNELTDGQQPLPSRLFWVLAVLGAPLAAAAPVAVVLAVAPAVPGCGGTVTALGVGAGAVSLNVLLCGEHGWAAVYAVLAVLYGWLLAYEPGVRRMGPRQRMSWVVAGVAISAVAVLVVFFVLLLIALRGDFLNLGLLRAVRAA